MASKANKQPLDTRSHFYPTTVPMATSELLYNSFPLKWQHKKGVLEIQAKNDTA